MRDATKRRGKGSRGIPAMAYISSGSGTGSGIASSLGEEGRIQLTCIFPFDPTPAGLNCTLLLAQVQNGSFRLEAVISPGRLAAPPASRHVLSRLPPRLAPPDHSWV